MAERVQAQCARLTEWAKGA